MVLGVIELSIIKPLKAWKFHQNFPEKLSQIMYLQQS